MTETYSLKSYQRTLNLVPEHKIDEYISIIENILDDRLEELENSDTAIFRETEREAYESLLENLDDFENKRGLYNWPNEAVETESLFPRPFDHLDVWASGREFLKAGYLEEVFEEAKGELEDSKF